MDDEHFQPNWVAWCHSLGKRPEDVDQDTAVNASFIVFISHHVETFITETGITKVGTRNWPERFSAWLTARYPEPPEPTP